MLKKDSMILGIVMGLLIPVAAFGILYGLNMLAKGIFHIAPLRIPTIVVASIFINALVFRYYLINLKKDLTGRGILLSTFILALVYFIKFW